MSQPQTYDQVPQSNIYPELPAIESESRPIQSKRQMRDRKTADRSSREVAPEDKIAWQADTPVSPVSPPGFEKKKISTKDKRVFDMLVKYFSWTKRTKGLARIHKVCFAFPYGIIMVTVFGGLLCTLLASLLLLAYQDDFSDAYKVSYGVLASFVSSEEIRVSRADCQLVGSQNIRHFLTMNDKFAMIIAIVSLVILIGLMVVIPLSKSLKGNKEKATLIVRMIAGSLSALCICKIVLIATIFYVPMDNFTQLRNSFLSLQVNDCFTTTSSGEIVTASLVAIEDEFDKLKVWMWVDLGAIAGILLFPLMDFLGALFKAKNKAVKSL